MRCLIHCQASERDLVDERNNIVRKFIYDPDNLPTGTTIDMLEKRGYQRLSCEFNGQQKEFMVDVLRRKLIVIRGIPFYSSSGTSEDQSVISPAWRRNVWMPCMGFEVQSKPGRIAKLGDKCSKDFQTFVKNLIDDWNKTVTDEEIKAIYLPRNRIYYARRDTLDDLISQIQRYGSIEAFAISMQLLPDNVWQDNDEEGGENFKVLRSLRDYYLSHYPNDYKLSEQELNEARSVSFEEFKENYHMLEGGEGKEYRFIESNEVVKEANRKNSYQLNLQLLQMGADINRLALLNNPNAVTPNTLSAQLASLIFDLRTFKKKQDAKTHWDEKINAIIKNLPPLEQEENIEKQQEKYKGIFESVYNISKNLTTKLTVKQISDLIKTNLSGIDHSQSASIHKEILGCIYQEYLQQLKQLTSDCIKHIPPKKPAYAVLTDLNNYLDDTEQAPQERIERFFKHLSENESKNLKVLQNDNSKDMKKFITGIAIIAAIVITAVIPGLLISAAVYAATGLSPLIFFKAKGTEFSENIDQLPEDLKKRPE